jgi:hypothetical protein
MSAPIADAVMAATHKLVQQAMTGQWQEVPKTIQERRDLLARLSSTARPQDQPWLAAAVARIAQSASSTTAPGSGPVGPASAGQSVVTEPTDAVATLMDMLGKGS